MVYCLQAGLMFPTAARRDAVLADIEQRVVGKPKYGDSTAVATTLRANPELPAILVEIRFTLKSDLEALADRIVAFATGPRLPEPGSWMTFHDCPHDEGDAPTCLSSIITRRDW